jgi:hypothetical protein
MEYGITVEAEYPLNPSAATTILANCVDVYIASTLPSAAAAKVQEAGGNMVCKNSFCLRRLTYDCLSDGVDSAGICYNPVPEQP